MKFRLVLPAIAGVTVLALSACSGSPSATAGDLNASSAASGSKLDLSGACPKTIVMQQDWQPEAEHGAMYSLVGSDYTFDEEKKSVKGSLVVKGTDTGVDIEVRPGGPNVGFQSVPALMYLDDSITIGAVNTDVAISSLEKQPTIAVTSQMTNSPQILMWDPKTYPDAKTIEDVVKKGATVVTAGDTIPALLAAKVGFDLSKSDTSYEGTPARFVSEPNFLQQGFVTAEPYIYEKEVPAWNKPIAYQLLSEIGYNIYPEPLAVRADRKAELAPCLSKLVPIMQQAQIDYLADPKPTNELIVKAVETYNLSWTYSAGVADYSAKTMIEKKIVTNDPASGVFGKFDPQRMQQIVDTFAPILSAQGTIPSGSVSPDSLYTNEFIDDSISMKG